MRFFAPAHASPSLSCLTRHARAALGALALGAALLPTTASASDEAERFFELRVRPLLAEHCYGCHGEDEASGGLRLDHRSAVFSGGDSGPAVEPGDVAASLLISAVRYEGLEMPPEAPLSTEEIAILEDWIARGAAWPEHGEGDHDGAGAGDEDPRQWWAYQPLDSRSIPETGADWGASPIDRYIAAGLEQAGLEPAPRADRVTLIRRLYLDLLGLPPQPEVVERFVADESPDAYRQLVDRLLASPEYGERWGRHWLDLVRYADSDGWRQDAYRSQAWRYRDWVVSAFNDDLPYDRFVALQLAGDEIAPGTPEGMAASGFLRLGIYEYNQRDAEGQWQLILDETADVAADVFLATSMACARCHDHKFDPIPRADYYHLRSYFEPLVWYDATSGPSTSEAVQRLRQWEEATSDLRAELETIEADARASIEHKVVDKFPLEVQAMFNKPASERNSYESQIAYLVQRQIDVEEPQIPSKLSEEQKQRREEILEQLAAFDSLRPQELEEVYMTVADAAGPTRPTRLPGRSAGREFEPRQPQILGGQASQPRPPQEAPLSTGRRSELAEWMTAPDNPLTPRVIVNRLWQHHFGRGLVSSENDFGRQGSPPSHPGLLDWMAQDLVESGWSLKRLQRQIVLSETYRQSSQSPQRERGVSVDPANQWLWHFPVRRLDAEQFRDAILELADRLQRRIGGESPSGAPSRRTVYLRRMRNSLDEMLRLLDAPVGLETAARRDATITAPQTLLLLNSPRTISTAGRIAERVQRDVGSDDPAAFVEAASRLLIGRPPAEQLREPLIEMAARGPQGRSDLCHVLINSNAFLFVE